MILDNLQVLQRMGERCDNDIAKLAAAKTGVAIALSDANAILSDNAAAIAQIQADIAADAAGDVVHQGLAGLSQEFLNAAQAKVASTIARLQAAQSTVANL